MGSVRVGQMFKLVGFASVSKVRRFVCSLTLLHVGRKTNCRFNGVRGCRMLRYSSMELSAPIGVSKVCFEVSLEKPFENLHW